MPEETVDPWREVLREAIEANSTQPVVGTRFRGAIDSAASKRGLRFPRPDEPELRFIDLLQRYPDVVSVLRRPGQDFLVVPTGKSDLLVKGIQQRLYGIRPDLFRAFTTVSRNLAYYDKNQDCVVWQEPEGQVLGSWVPIDPTTESAEVQLRRNFVETLPEAAKRSQLDSALTSPKPLQTFGRAVRETGVQREWHSFRTERLLEKIQTWAKEKQIEWKEGWLCEVAPNYAWKTRTFSSDEVAKRTESNPLQILFSGLDATDCAFR